MSPIEVIIWALTVGFVCVIAAVAVGIGALIFTELNNLR